MKYCRKGRFSLVVQQTNLRYLGLVSLREVKGGSVGIGGNPQLCHVESFSWTAATIVRAPHGFVAGGNADKNKCRKYFCQGLFLAETIACIEVLYLKLSHLRPTGVIRQALHHTNWINSISEKWGHVTVPSGYTPTVVMAIDIIE